MRFLTWLLLILAVAAPVRGATLVVPDGFPSIGAALGSATAGDTVLVRPGTYPEHVQMVDGIVLRGDDPFDRPVIEGLGSGVVLRATACTTGVVVEDMILQNGSSAAVGGGAAVTGSVATFRNCDFLANSAEVGGGMGSTGSMLTLDGCRFAQNSATVSGGALALTDVSSPLIQGCVFRDNDAFAGGAVAVRNGCTPSVTECVFDGDTADQGAAIWYDFLTGGTFASCTVVNATATGGSGGALYFSALASPSVTHNVVAFGAGGGATFSAPGASPVYDCNCRFGNVGGDALLGGTDLGTSFVADPLFCNPGGSEFTLSSESPCAPDSSCGLVGALPVDCGATGVEGSFVFETWGATKSRWR